MPISIIFRQINSIIYEGDEEPYFMDTKPYKNVPISFPISILPLHSNSSRIKKANLNKSCTKIHVVMSIHSAHVIFHDIIYCLRASNRDKQSLIKEVLMIDDYFMKNMTNPIDIYIDGMMMLNTHKIFDVEYM